MTKSWQYFFYIFFALLSTIINIGTQRLFEIIVSTNWESFYYFKVFKVDLGLTLQILTATGVSFIFKYFVDKLFIFKDSTSYFSKEHFKQVILYTFFAIFTTIIFWFTEISFDLFFDFSHSKYLGALIGLAIGYTIKFFLDRKFVFNVE